MDKNTDLTNFWLGWKATCAIRDCMNKTQLIKKCKEASVRPDAAAIYQDVIADADGVAGLAQELIEATNREFIGQLKYFGCGGKRTSVYGDQAANWKEANSGSAFELVEGVLYEKQGINGRSFKSYLFEQIGGRKGCLSGNLYGYIRDMAKTLAERSFKAFEEKIEQPKDDEGKELEPDYGSTEDQVDAFSRSPELNLEISQVGEFFKKYIDELGEDWDDDYWIVLYTGLNKMPIHNHEVAALCKRKKSTLSEIYSKTMGNLLKALRGQFSDRAIGGALAGDMQKILDKKIGGKGFYPQLEALWMKMYGTTGK